MYIWAVVRFLSRCKRCEVVYEQAKCVDFNWAKSSRQKRFLPDRRKFPEIQNLHDSWSQGDVGFRLGGNLWV